MRSTPGWMSMSISFEVCGMGGSRVVDQNVELAAGDFDDFGFACCDACCVGDF